MPDGEYVTATFHRDYGPCHRCGKRLIGSIPVLLQLARNGEVVSKQLCDQCFIAVFDSIKPLEVKTCT